MTMKIAVSLPDDQVAAARAAVAEGRAASVSAYVSEALARRSMEEELLDLLDRDEAAGPPATEEHRAWARRALGTDQPRPAAPATSSRSTKTTRSGRGTKTKSGAVRQVRTGEATGTPSSPRG